MTFNDTEEINNKISFYDKNITKPDKSAIF